MCIPKLSLRFSTLSFLLSVSIPKLLVCSVRFSFCLFDLSSGFCVPTEEKICSDGQEEFRSCSFMCVKCLALRFFCFTGRLS